MFVWLSLLMNENLDFDDVAFFGNNMVVKCLWVSFLENPHETSLVLWGIPRGLKDLLHMLNAIVSPMKANLCFLF